MKEPSGQILAATVVGMPSNGLKNNGKDVIELFLSGIDAKESTRITYRKAMTAFLSWVGDSGRKMSTMSTPDIIAFKDELLENGKSSLTVNLYLSVVRKFYKWTALNSLYPNIAAEVGSVRRTSESFRKMHLESDEGAKLLEYESKPKVVRGKTEQHTRMLNDKQKEIAIRNYALVNLMLRTGLRTIEVSRLDVGDIVKKRGKYILRVWGKGHAEKDDFVVLTEETLAPIKEYLKIRPEAEACEPLFICEGLDSKGRRLSARRIQAICKEGLRSIGLDGHEYSAHSLRHTTGTEILHNGGNMFDVQKVLRHANPATSELYVKTIEADERIDNASEVLLDKSFK